jgi:3-oxoacyl-[acyl-carrier-protein] synthase II
LSAFVAGVGAVSALGHGQAAQARALFEGRSGIGPVRGFSTEGYDVHLAGLVPDVEHEARAEPEPARRLCLAYALDAAREALSRDALEGVAPERVALILGVSLGPAPSGLHGLAHELARALGLAGPAFVVSTACTSSTIAIGLGLELLRAGQCDAALVGGADVLTPVLFSGFHALGLLSPEPCAPWSYPFGTTLGEGAGFLLLRQPGAEVLRNHSEQNVFFVSGYGLSCDAHHPTSPDPMGGGVARALAAALAHAEVDPGSIDYVSAHGTGTESNDPAEWRAVREVLPHAPPTSSSKSFLGHAQGAAGVLELAATLASLEQGAVPPTRGFTRARPRGPKDAVPAELPRALDVGTFLKTSSAFGGSNAALVLSRRAPEPRAPRRLVRACAVGAVSPRGAGASLQRGLAREPPATGRAPVVTPSSLARADERALDPGAVSLTAACEEALAEARLAPRGASRARIGLFAATTRISPRASRELEDSITQRGMSKLSALAFTRQVLNAQPGVVARALGLRGATATVTSGFGGGLLAAALAALYLQTHGEVDHLLAGAVEERGDDERSGLDGAACVLFGAAPAGADDGLDVAHDDVLVAGVGLAGARAEATRLALAGLAPSRVAELETLDVPAPSAERASALPSALALVDAVLEARASRRPTLVVDAHGTLATALLLTPRTRSS